MSGIDITCPSRSQFIATHTGSGTQLPIKSSLDAGDPAFAPTDLVAAALGACMLGIVGTLANRHGIDMSNARATVTKSMSERPGERIAALDVELILPADPPERRKAMFERAVRTCPVHRSLHPDIDVHITFRWNG